MGMPRVCRRTGITAEKQRGGTLLGILLGLALGAVIAFGIAFWFIGSSPFSSRQQTDKGKEEPVGTPRSSVEYGFYDRLKQGMSETIGSKAKPADQPKPGEQKAPAAPATLVPVPPVPQVSLAVPEPPKETGTSRSAEPPKTQPAERVYWQIGAFATEKEASRVRAELALAGIPSTVEPARMPDGRTLYRVRTGPYASQDEAQAARARLLAAGYAPTLVK